MNARNSSLLSTVFLILSISACDEAQTTVAPLYKTLQQSVFASGHLAQEDEYVIAATAEGIIQELNIREGDRVKQGSLLLRIKSEVLNTQLQDALAVHNDAVQNAQVFSPQLQQLQTQINLAKTQLEQDRLNYERYRDLRSKNSASQLELDKAEMMYKASSSNVQVLEKNFQQAQDALALNAKRSLLQVKTQQALLNEYNIRADKAGVVVNVYKKKGELVRKGEIIARIGSGPYLLKLFIAEEDITKVSIGQKLSVQMNNYPDTLFSAHLSKILPAFDQSQQSYLAEAVFEQVPPLLLSGTQLQVNIDLQDNKKILVIPSRALIRGQFVQLKDGGEKRIKVGQKLGKWVEIKAGLTTDDRIVLPKGNPEEEEGLSFPGAE